MGDLLFLAHRVPYPPDKGDKIRAYHVLRHLAQTFRIHLGCFADDPKDEQYRAQLADLCATVFVAPLSRKTALARGLGALALGGSLSEFYFHDARMTRFVADTMARVRPENIFLFCSAMAPYAMPYARTHRVHLDLVDVDSEKWRAYSEKAAWPLNRLYGRESRALLRLERRSALAFDRSFFVSKAEADTFLEQAPEASGRVGHFQNGVDLEYFNPARDFANPFDSQTLPIVFTGTMDYRPNIEAVEWFAEKVFPGIRRSNCKAAFWIVGANPAPRVAKLAHKPAIRVTGRVPDVRPYLSHAACVVAPLHIARGVQNKMLEAMAMARPVVATPAACEGLSAIAGKDVLLAETPSQFADAVCSVIVGGSRGLGNAARLRVETDYDWYRNLQVLDRVLCNPQQLVEAGARTEPALRAMGITP
jgi:sugar transferase (PEP-CTERM/EpsH1 system associated)